MSFRHLFHETKRSTPCTPSSSERTSAASEENVSSPTSKVFYQMLTSQADQIQKLQEQLSELMHSRLSDPGPASPSGNPAPNKVQAVQARYRQMHNTDANDIKWIENIALFFLSLPSSPMVDTSTQTSAPPSPKKGSSPSPQCKCQSPDRIAQENTRSSIQE